MRRGRRLTDWSDDLDAGIAPRVFSPFFGASRGSTEIRIELVVESAATRIKNLSFSGRRTGRSGKLVHIIYSSVSITDTAVGQARATHLAGTVNDSFVCSSACSRISARRDGAPIGGNKGLECACEGGSVHDEMPPRFERRPAWDGSGPR